MEFTPAISREFRPYKPDPAPLLHICSTWDVQPNEVIMIGDSLKDDVSAFVINIVTCYFKFGDMLSISLFFSSYFMDTIFGERKKT